MLVLDLLATVKLLGGGIFTRSQGTTIMNGPGPFQGSKFVIAGILPDSPCLKCFAFFLHVIIGKSPNMWAL